MVDARIEALDDFLSYFVQTKEYFENELREIILSKARLVVERQDLLDYIYSREDVWLLRKAAGMGICLHLGQCPHHSPWTDRCWNRNNLSYMCRRSYCCYYDVLWITEGYNGFRDLDERWIYDDIRSHVNFHLARAGVRWGE